MSKTRPSYGELCNVFIKGKERNITVKCKKCGKIIAEPKELIRIINGIGISEPECP